MPGERCDLLTLGIKVLNERENVIISRLTSASLDCMLEAHSHQRESVGGTWHFQLSLGQEFTRSGTPAINHNA